MLAYQFGNIYKSITTYFSCVSSCDKCDILIDKRDHIYGYTMSVLVSAYSLGILSVYVLYATVLLYMYVFNVPTGYLLQLGGKFQTSML